MSSHLTPMQVCELLIGSPEEIGRIVGLHPKSTYPWRHASKNRDAGDLPSAKIMRCVLRISDARGLGLEPRHLILGATEDEVAAILAARPAAQATREAA